jgi:hypothetical protein
VTSGAARDDAGHSPYRCESDGFPGVSKIRTRATPAWRSGRKLDSVPPQCEVKSPRSSRGSRVRAARHLTPAQDESMRCEGAHWGHSMRCPPDRQQTHCDEHSCSNEPTRVRHQTTTRMGQPPRLSWASVTPRGTTEHRARQPCLPACNLRIGAMRAQYARANRVLNRQARHSDGYRHLHSHDWSAHRGTFCNRVLSGRHASMVCADDGSGSQGEEPRQNLLSLFPICILEYCFRALGDQDAGEIKK